MQKSVAVGMGVNSACDQILAVGQGVVIFFQPNEPAGAAQVAQRVDDGLQLVAAEAGTA